MAGKQVIHTTFFSRPEKYKPWSAGLVVPPGHGLLFTPGMTARDAQGEAMHVGDATAQARRIFDQIEAVVTEAGAAMEDVIRLTVYLVDLEDAVPIQKVRTEIWPEDPPVSATVQVAYLAGGARVEIDAMAMLPAA
jgi:2-iminobutanoate/2-iminopropanoate deaminase